jgi:catechol-2,3-dioxygenase
MIEIRRIDHVCLRVADVGEAAARWSIQFGLTERERREGRALLSCDDEPYSLELVEDGEPGHDHTAFELRRHCTLEQAAAHLDRTGVAYREQDGVLAFSDPDGRGIHLVPFRPTAEPWVPHARRTKTLPAFHPRKIGHVNCLTAAIREGVEFYCDVLGMRVTDWLGEDGVWFHIHAEHHVVALINRGTSHFHHLAFDLVDVGMLRVAFDHLGRHGRWLAWGPVRHGVGGNICGYVRIPEERCFVELYCDMEQLDPDHEVRHWPDDRFSSNTWGALPPRSYFRFDAEAIESERESLEQLGIPLAP